MKTSMFAVLALLAFWSSSSIARSETEAKSIEIVFDLEHSFLQRVPERSVKNLDPNEVVQIEGHDYALAPDSIKAIQRLQRDPRVSISLASEFSKEQTTKIAQQLRISNVRNIITRSALSPIDPEKTLKSACSEVTLTHCVLVTDSSAANLKDSSGQSGHLLRSGQTYFHFDSFDQARHEAERLKKEKPEAYEKLKDSFPPDENSFNLHRDRMRGVFEQLQSSLNERNSDFSAALIAHEKDSLADSEKAGAVQLARVVGWTAQGGEALGCHESAPGSSEKIRLPLSVCLNELPRSLRWVGSPKNRCAWTDESGKIVVKSEPVDRCLEELKINYFWADKELKTCGAFNEDNIFVKSAPKEKCTLNVVCSLSDGVLTEFNRNVVGGLVFRKIKSLAEVQSEYRLPDDRDDLEVMSHQNLTHRGTFAFELLDAANGREMIKDLGEPCASFIQKIYKSGDTLWSWSLYKAAIPVTEIPFASGKHAPTFYHYTKTSDLPKLLHPEIKDRKEANRVSRADGSYDKIFEFYRARQADTYKFWRRVHYLAEDRSSSSFEGNILATFNLDPRARTIQWNDDTWIRAIREVDARHPGLAKACGADLPVPVSDTYGRVNFNEILFIIAEDSEIDVVDYNQQERWFQLIGPRSIVSTDVK